MIWWTRPNFAHFLPLHVICWTLKTHVIWWTQIKIFPWPILMWFDGPRFIRVFNCFSPLAPSCVLMDPLRDQNLMCFPGPKPHVSWWTVDDFQGPSNQMRFLGPQKRRSTQKTHVIWWTQPNFFTTSCALMDPDFKPHWVHQITWVSRGPKNYILPIQQRRGKKYSIMDGISISILGEMSMQISSKRSGLDKLIRPQPNLT